MLEPLKQLKSKMNIRERWELLVRAHEAKMKKFEPKLRFQLQKDKYVIKTVDSIAELEAVLKLRHDVFLQEVTGQSHLTGLDFDDFDLLCDHLIVVDSQAQEILGTYRVMCSLFTDRYYTATEFNIEQLLALPGIKMELGRACIRKTHRTGMVMQLLWRAIAQYIKLSEAKHLFGCASVFTTKTVEAAVIQMYLQHRGALSEPSLVTPVEKYTDPQLAETIAFLAQPALAFNLEGASQLIPALFKSYLKLGSKICGLPALDRDFSCYDYVTWQEVGKFDESIERKYGLAQGS